MIRPPFLKPGDTVAIAATARKIEPADIEYAVKVFENWGWKVVLPEGLFAQQNQLAGGDEERTAIFQSLIDDPEIKAIFCARGGYGTIRMVDGLVWDKFVKNPKWVVGYSDITVLHNHLYQTLGVASIHGTMAFNITNEPERQTAIQSLRNVLEGKQTVYSLPSHPLNRESPIEGVLVGGNLSVLYSLMGSNSFPDTDSCILFLEDLDEYLYHIDRMMTALKRAQKLNNLAALIVGGMTEMRDNAVPFGKTAEEILYDTVKEYKYPVYFGIEAGHIKRNQALIIGHKVAIKNNELLVL